jgi:hypothetical protein
LVSIAQGILGAFSTDDEDSLQRRRRDIRRRRRSGLIRGGLVAAGWGTVALLAVWLLLSGIFGLSGA